MAVDLIEYVPTLKREVQPPGADLYAGSTDSDWVGHLVDAFWEARLDGLLEGYTASVTPGESDGEIVPITASDPEIGGRGLALVVLYAGIRVLRGKILASASTGIRAKAGPVEFEQNPLATVLAEMLKQLRATKERILDELEAESVIGGGTSVTVLDTYSTRLFNPNESGYFASIGLSG